MYERIAEIIMKNLGEIGVQTTLDEESVRNSDFANQLRADGTYELFICYSTQGVGMFKTAYMYIIDEGPGAKWGSCLDPELLDAYHALQELRTTTRTPTASARCSSSTPSTSTESACAGTRATIPIAPTNTRAGRISRAGA